MESDSRKIVKRPVSEGDVLVSVAGSHHKFRKDGKVVVVPHPKKDLPAGTARAMARPAGRKGRNDAQLYGGRRQGRR